jgi:hypothetical protein
MMHLIQIIMPPDLHVHLKKSSIHPLLHLQRFYFYRRGIIRSLPSLRTFVFTLFIVIPFLSTSRAYLYKFWGDLDIPIDLYLPLHELFLFISWENPLAKKVFLLWISMFFHLISSDNKDETTSLKIKVVALLPMAITRLSHKSRDVVPLPQQCLLTSRSLDLLNLRARTTLRFFARIFKNYPQVLLMKLHCANKNQVQVSLTRPQVVTACLTKGASCFETSCVLFPSHPTPLSLDPLIS